MSEAPRLLIRHPSPNSTESFAGYLLRLTEVNGYPNTHRMLADRGGHQKGDPIDIQRLAAMTGWSDPILRTIAVRSQDNKTSLVLGQGVAREEVKANIAPICPTCIREVGFMEAHFSLPLMIICPVHKVLLNVCPACSRHLTWNRPGLIQCDCGQILSDPEVQRVSTAVVELLAIVRAKVLSLSSPTESVSGLPVRALAAMSLKSLLFLIRTLGRRYTEETLKGKPWIHEQKIVESAAQVLSAWPTNFRAMLDTKAGPASLSKPCNLTTGPLKPLNLAIMYGFNQREEAMFVRDEMVKYAADRFGLGTGDLDERARILGDSRRYLTRGEIAAKFGVDKRFANFNLSKGLIDTIRVEVSPNRERILIDMSAVIPFSRVAKIYHTQEAADLIGIPARVLGLLKETGMFEAHHLPPGVRGFHEQDVEAYKARLLNPAAGPRCSAQGKMLSLGRFLIGPRPNAMTKAMVIAEIYAGRMPVAIPPAKTVQEIQISQEVLVSLIRTLTVPAWRVLRGSSPHLSNQLGGISTGQAAREIGCLHGAVCVLVHEGRLRRLSGNGSARWVSAESVDTFRAQFESLSSLARKVSSSSGFLMRICNALDLHLLVVNLANGTRNAFIRIGDIPKVTSGLQHVGCADSTRLRWERRAQMRTSIGTKETVVKLREFMTHEAAHEECAA